MSQSAAGIRRFVPFVLAILLVALLAVALYLFVIPVKMSTRAPILRSKELELSYVTRFSWDEFSKGESGSKTIFNKNEGSNLPAETQDKLLAILRDLPTTVRFSQVLTGHDTVLNDIVFQYQGRGYYFRVGPEHAVVLQGGGAAFRLSRDVIPQLDALFRP